MAHALDPGSMGSGDFGRRLPHTFNLLIDLLDLAADLAEALLGQVHALAVAVFRAGQCWVAGGPLRRRTSLSEF